MAKYIHYCWFGGKPLPSLAKKCIKSWKKYLPEFEIIRWDETNCDINECEFVKGAYENKKWAFVADYFRAKILKEYGGIYFDTDMEIKKDIKKLLEDDTFLGVEDSGHIAVGVWWEKNTNSYLTNYLLDFYKKQRSFDIDNMYTFSIPKLMTEALEKKGYKNNSNKIQNIDNIIIYPREYFYPLSYDRQDNLFTEKTCMIHYYDATWVPKWEKNQIKLIRIFGREKTTQILNFISKIKRFIKKIIKLLLFPYVLYRSKKHQQKFYSSRKEEFLKELNKISNNKEIVIHNKHWLGTTFATKELFKNTVGLFELYENDNLDFYAEKLINKKPKIIIFSAFSLGWKELIIKIKEKEPSIPIKILWHGSNAMHMENYDFEMFRTLFYLLDNSYIESIGFVKESMFKFYKELGYNVEFVKNTVKLEHLPKKTEKNNNQIKIGLYASGDRWVKNFYNQLSGASLIENSVIDIIPLSQRTKDFAKIIKANITGVNNSVSRKELLNRMAQNDINIYATFVECAPITPLESLELGVPCITGNNHHYWDNTELEKYLIVDKVDNCIAIKEKIELCLKNKEKILSLYNEWKKDYDIEAQKSIVAFINGK